MLFLFTFQNKEEQIFADLKKNSQIFKNLNFFTKLKTFKTHLKKKFIIHKPSLWSHDVPQKILARSVQPF